MILLQFIKSYNLIKIWVWKWRLRVLTLCRQAIVVSPLCALIHQAKIYGSYFKKWFECIGARLMHVGDCSIYLNWLLENIYNKVPNSNSGKNYELF